jgi:peptide/nickel transport system substrate-binding protein
MKKDVNELERLWKTGNISRREFIRAMSALGLAAAVSPALLASPVRAAIPKKGGRFRIGLTGASTSDSLDPATLDDQMDIHACFCIRNQLVELNPDGSVVPELAESWDASADAMKWTFKLRQGVEFHNGKPLTAEDVIYSINHHRGEKSKSGAKGLVAQIEDIRAEGKYEVVFTLKGGNADFPYVLNDYHLLIAPTGTQGAAWDDGIGTGGYRLEDWEPGVRAFFKRNPNYFKEGRAHFDEVEILGINDGSARTSALKTGQIDYMNRADFKTAHLLEKMPGIQLIRTRSGFHYTLPMLTDVPPFDSNDVRLAIKYAVNREQLLANFLRGYGTIGNDHPILLQPYHADALPQRTYDPDKARFHLKKAGLENHTFELHTSALGGFVDMAVLFKEQAAKAGINIKLIQHPEDGYWTNVWLKKPFLTCYWAARPTCDMQLSTAYSGDAPWNDTHFKHQRFDELITAARSELDEEKRRDMYLECQRILRDEGGAVIPFFKDNVEAASDKVAFAEMSGALECDGHRASERMWFV